MDAIPSNLCTLVEQLEDARQFHDGAARRSASFQRDCHSERSRAYATMLSEIRDWESRRRQSVLKPRDFLDTGDSGRALLDDSYAALLERVYRIHSSVAPTRRTIGASAAGAVIGGSAVDGRWHAGESMAC
ncbi:MAG: hypothetical protein ACREPZ_11295 [Rhodanobacteraceae bacterium]